MKVKHTRNGLNATKDITNSKGYTILARVNYTHNGLNATNDVKISKGYKILVKVKHTRHGLTAAKDLKNSKGYKMLVRVKYTRNGVNTTKDLKSIKRPHLMKRCQKPKTSYSQRFAARHPLTGFWPFRSERPFGFSTPFSLRVRRFGFLTSFHQMRALGVFEVFCSVKTITCVLDPYEHFIPFWVFEDFCGVRPICV